MVHAGPQAPDIPAPAAPLALQQPIHQVQQMSYLIISLWWKYRNIRCICNAHKTGSYTLRLWRTTNFRGIQKHTSYKIILGIISYRWFKASGRNRKRILTKVKIDRQ